MPRAVNLHDLVWRIVDEHGPLTHDQIVDEYAALCRRVDAVERSAQAVRTVTAKLVREGLVEADPVTGSSSAGYPANRWRVTASGAEAGGERPAAPPVRARVVNTHSAAAATASTDVENARLHPLLLALIICILDEHGPLTHDQIIDEFHRLSLAFWGQQMLTPEWIRTATAQLVTLEVAAPNPIAGRSHKGYKARRFQLVTPLRAS